MIDATAIPGDSATSTRAVIMWWEWRRPVYNAVLLAIGVLSTLVMELLMSRVIKPGEDAIEPLGMLVVVTLYGVMANVCYTFGWIAELFLRKSVPENSRAIGKSLFRAGFVISGCLTTAPLWFGLVFWTFAKLSGRVL